MSHYFIENKYLKIGIASFGATITHFFVKNNPSPPTDIVLGFDNLKDYQSQDYLDNCPYFGCVVGRYANRIGNSRFTINNTTYLLSANADIHHLHGGLAGFHRKNWKLEKQSDTSLELFYLSMDGEEGYPGNLSVHLTFLLKENTLAIHYHATSDKPCFVNLTHHPYFNLSKIETTINHHILQINSEKELETEHLIPTGKIVPAPPYHSFTNPHSLNEVIEKHDGIDHTFLFDNHDEIIQMATLSHPLSPIVLKVMSDYPSAQIYTGAFIPKLMGKGEREYGAYSGIAIEPQHYPDAPNHGNFPDSMLALQEVYNHTILYQVDII